MTDDVPLSEDFHWSTKGTGSAGRGKTRRERKREKIINLEGGTGRGREDLKALFRIWPGARDLFLSKMGDHWNPNAKQAGLNCPRPGRGSPLPNNNIESLFARQIEILPEERTNEVEEFLRNPPFSRSLRVETQEGGEMELCDVGGREGKGRTDIRRSSEREA